MKWAWMLAALLPWAMYASGQAEPATATEATESTNATPAISPVTEQPGTSVPAETANAPVHAEPEASATPALPSDCCLLPAGTLVQIEIAESIGSQRRKRGEQFPLRLAESLMIDAQTMLPAGTPGVGEIIHAAPSGGGGKPGELLLAARYLEYEGSRIPLKGFRIGAAGKDTSNAALGASFALGPFAQFIHGHEIEIPVGARATAKLAADTHLSPTNPTTTPRN